MMLKYIESIEITKFRSFGKDEDIECEQINIFSGGNDSGKSNVLKALNLFFNERTTSSSPYLWDDDFNKWFRDNNISGERNIIIRLKIAAGNYFDPSVNEHIGINEGFYAQKTFQYNGAIVPEYFDKNESKITDSKSYNRADAIIREKIKYIYIPAIRDAWFRKAIQRDLMSIANSADKRSVRANELKGSFDDLESKLKQQLSYLGRSVKDYLGISVSSSITFQSLMESLTFDTIGEVNINRRRGKTESLPIPMESRGDGLQMQFLAFILWYVAKEDKKHYYIWGYEEPEIAYEFKRQLDVAKLFVEKFAQSAQLFITTHSPAFAFYQEQNNICRYRVVKQEENGRKISHIFKISDYREQLFQALSESKSIEERSNLEQDIWGLNYQYLSRILGSTLTKLTGIRYASESDMAELMKQLEQKDKEIFEQKQHVNELKQSLEEIYPQRIFICEDKLGVPIWKNLMEKYGIDISTIDFRVSGGCLQDTVEISIGEIKKKRQAYDPYIFRHVDRDGYSAEQITFLEENKKQLYAGKICGSDHYLVKFLPVNEIENFAVMVTPAITPESITGDTNKYDQVNDAFLKTTKSNLLACQKKWGDNTNIFKNVDEYTLRNSAKTDIIRFFPGKDICKLQRNLKCSKILKDMSLPDFPQELKDYLETIKQHLFPDA